MNVVQPVLCHMPILMCIVLVLGNLSLLRQVHEEAESQVQVAESQVHEAAPNQCSCILITSQGGVGSSSFMLPIQRSNKYCVNDASNRDWLKHSHATIHRFHTSYGIRWRSKCFGKVLVIVGDPLHTIQSTYSRFEWAHINLLRKTSKEIFPAEEIPYFNKTHNLNDAYDIIASIGKDVTGISYYIQSWYNASQNTAEWPGIKMVTTEFLYNHANDVATWLGIDDEELQKKFSQMSYDVTNARDYTIGVPAVTVNVFQETIELVNKIGKEATI